MPDASFVQSSFLGGEWSKYAQGRFDKQTYVTAMNVCFNSVPLEEGACTRRPGTRFISTTRRGLEGRLIPFDFEAASPYNMEFTDGHIRFFGSRLGSILVPVTTPDDINVVSISTATPAVVTIGDARDYATDDEVIFRLIQNDAVILSGISDIASAFAPIIRNRTFKIMRLTSTTFSLFDAITGAPLDGAEVNWGTGPGGNYLALCRLHDITTSPYTSDQLADVRSVQSDVGAVLLHGDVEPVRLTKTDPTEVAFAQFAMQQYYFDDGPYLDPYDLSGTPTGVTDEITFTIPANSLFVFRATDVGRSIRFFSEPDAWDAGTTYAIGDQVAFGDIYYISLTANTGVQPDTSATDWSVTTTAARWTWGVISVFLTNLSVKLHLRGGDLLYANTINLWQIGVFSDTTGWPTCGTYHEGRLWLSGAVPNRIDSSKSNDIFNFAPTSSDGTVADDNGISYTFNATDTNPVFWMQPGTQGLICGTQGGEWFVQASQLSDPLTPTSIQAHRVTKYGCANIEPRETGSTIVFVQRFGRKLFEYFPEVFSGRFTAPNLTLNAAHVSSKGIAELAFQKERTPIVWARMGDGNLAGMTYKRDSLMSSQGPEFVAWHRHSLGCESTVESICVGPSQFSNIDSLSLVTNSGSNVRHVTTMTDIFDENDTLNSAWFLDDAVIPSGGVVNYTDKTVTFHGLWHLNGKTVSIFAAGLDCGTAAVVNGSLTLPFGDGIENLFSLDYIRSVSGVEPEGAVSAASMMVPVDIPQGDSTTVYVERITIPVVIGCTYMSQGQSLRRIAPQEAGAANGPALGKTRRAHQYTALFVNTVSAAVSIGTDFDHLKPASFRTNGNKDIPVDQLFSGVHQDTIDDVYGYDSMICWQIMRPLPATIAAFGGFLQTQDR